MGSKCDYLENLVLDCVLRGTSWPGFSSVWLALYTSDPTDTGNAGTEVTGGSYVRKQLTTFFVAASGGATDNNALIAFVASTAAWGTITHWVLRDASTSGNPLYQGALTTPKPMTSGDVFQVLTGDLDVTET